MKPLFTDISEDVFLEKFSTQESCLLYLSQLKWGATYTCKKCSHTNYCEGKTPFSRRCTRCKHDESPTVGTLFEGCRFPLPKAFYIAYIVCHHKSISLDQISEKIQLRKMTCWSFKKKLLDCVSQNQDFTSEYKINLEKLIIQSE